MNSNILTSTSGRNQFGTENSSHVHKQIMSKYNLRYAVETPTDEDQNEWIANNIFDFHKQICMLYGTINKFCTADSCPKMTAGKKYEYYFTDGPQRDKVNLAASDYIHHLLDWVQEILDDKNIFPSAPGVKFPENYKDVCRTISKRLLRVYAHVYHHHSQDLVKLEEVAHMNTSLEHYIYFVQRHKLVTGEELEPLKDFVQSLEDKQQVNGTDILSTAHSR